MHRPLYTRMVNSEGISRPFDLLTRQTCIDLDIMRVKLNEKTVDILKILSCYSVQIENSSRTFLVKQSKYCDIKYCSSFF